MIAQESAATLANPAVPYQLLLSLVLDDNYLLADVRARWH